MSLLWGFLASPAASVAVGLAGFIILVKLGHHRDTAKRTAHAKIAMAVLQSAALYTMLVAIIGHWFLKIPVSETIRSGFGDERFAWLMLGLSLDAIGRLYSLFDP